MKKILFFLLAALSLCASAQHIDITKNVSGMGTNVATFLATPSSANFAAALTDESGSGKVLFSDSGTLKAPNLTVQTLAVTSTPTWNMSLGNMGTVALSGASITPTITNSPTAGFAAFKITQDSTPRTITWPAGNGSSTLKIYWPSGTAPTLTSTTGAVDDVSCQIWSQFQWHCVWTGNFQ